MGCGAAMVNKADQSANEILLEMVVQGFGLLRDASRYLSREAML